MQKLTETEFAPRRRWRFVPRLALIGAAAIVALVLFMPRSDSPAMNLMAQSAEAMSNLASVHITARMRTLPGDNFEYIDPKLDWVPLEIWKQFGDTPKWRVEKPGRIAVMDGTSSIMLMGSESAVRGGRYPGFLDWLNGLLDTARIMDRELAGARAGQSTARLAQQDRHFILAVHRATAGDPRNDWLLSSSVSTSNHTRVYRFDAATRRLESMQVVLHTASGDVPVFEITAIRYNETFDPAVFTLNLPDNVVWSVPADQMPAAHSLPQSPKEAASMFFDGLSRQDWDTLLAVYSAGAPPKWATHYAGLQVVSLGEPYQVFPYPGWFVPYQFSLNGHTKKWQLAVRNDNPTHRWVFDGGF